MVTSPLVGVGRGNKLKIFAQNIRGLGYKIDELSLHCINDTPHRICLSEHHLNSDNISSVLMETYNLGSYYARRVAKCGGVCIFLHKSCKFVKIDLNSHCIERDFEICAV